MNTEVSTMTTINNAKDSNHLYFLYGIVAYGCFYLLWGSTLPVFMTMERLLHPTAVLIATSVAELALFCFLFRKPKLIDIKWIPFVGIIILPTVISILVFKSKFRSAIAETFLENIRMSQTQPP